MSGGDFAAAVGAVGDGALVFAVEGPVAHVDFVEFVVEVVFGEREFVADELPEGLVDHEGLGEVGLEHADLRLGATGGVFGIDAITGGGAGGEGFPGG